MDEVTASILDLQDAMAQVDWTILERFNERITNLHDSLSDIRDLINEDDWFDDAGGWTEDGLAVVATYIQDLEMYKNELENINSEIAKFENPYAGNETYYAELGLHSENEYYDKLQELKESQVEFTKGIKDSEDAVVDMYNSQIDALEEYHSTLVDSYSDYIDYVKETLDAERELYEFKKNVQKQTKDIAETERKIASLAGSTNQADIAERRKLQAQLLEQRESLEEEYRSNAQDAQIEALEAEVQAYEDATNRYIQNLRDTIDKATKDTSDFVSKVAVLVTSNADIVLKKYQETGLELDEALTTPWQSALDAMEEFGGPAGLGVMNSWTTQGGFFDTFMQNATIQLTYPWGAGLSAMNAFGTGVDSAMRQVRASVQTNVEEVVRQLGNITSTAARAQAALSGLGGGGISVDTTEEKSLHYEGLTTERLSAGKEQHVAGQLQNINGDYYYQKGLYLYKASDLEYEEQHNGLPWVYIKKGAKKYSYYAKGTTGTKKDEWAVTDEPQWGDELTLVPGKSGNLSFMRKGTGVVPAKLTQELMDIGAVGLDGLMNANTTAANINMINNAVSKPELNFSFDALVKADRIDEGTLPAVKDMVQTELNKFMRNLNYKLRINGAY